MLSLSNNIKAILAKRSSVEWRYIVKLTGASNTYYFGTTEMEITDSTAQRVSGYMRNIPKIKQVVDIHSGRSSVGGFTVDLVNADIGGGTVADWITGEYFYNREIKLYLWVTGLSTLSDCILVYTGLFENYEISRDIVSISVISGVESINREVPETKITAENYPGINSNSIGGYAPIVYGDHNYYVGKLNLDYMTIDRTNNMVTALKYGEYGRLLVSSHEMKSIDSIWGYDTILGRYVKAAGFHIVQNNSNGCIVEVGENLISLNTGSFSYNYTDLFYDTTSSPFADILPGDVLAVEYGGDIYYYIVWYKSSASSIRLNKKSGFSGSGLTYRVYRPNIFYDIYNPSGSTNYVDSGLYTQWENEGYAGNNNLTQGTSLDTEYTSYNTIKLAIQFSTWENDSIESTDIIEVKVYAKSDCSDSLLTIAEINGVDIQSNGVTVLTDCGTMANTLEGINNIVEVIVDDIDDDDDPIRMTIYHVWKQIKYKNIGIEPSYVACEGYDISGETYDGNPGVIAKHIIDTYTDATPDTSAFTDMETRTGNTWLLSFAIYTQQNTKDILEQIAKAAKSYFHFNAVNEASCFTFTSSYTSARQPIMIDDIKVGSFSVSKSKMQEAVNSLILNYYNTDGNKSQAQITRTNSTTAGYLNETVQKVINDKYIKDTTTAGLLADHYCQNSSVAFWGMPRNIVEFETADFRGISFWDGATFEPIGALELFDIIEFDHTEFDDYLKCNGASWDNKQFLIFEITRGLTTLKIKAVEL